jgi:hypothetical protein
MPTMPSAGSGRPSKTRRRPPPRPSPTGPVCGSGGTTWPTCSACMPRGTRSQASWSALRPRRRPEPLPRPPRRPLGRRHSSERTSAEQQDVGTMPGHRARGSLPRCGLIVPGSSRACARGPAAPRFPPQVVRQSLPMTSISSVLPSIRTRSPVLRRWERFPATRSTMEMATLKKASARRASPAHPTPDRRSAASRPATGP